MGFVTVKYDAAAGDSFPRACFHRSRANRCYRSVTRVADTTRLGKKGRGGVWVASGEPLCVISRCVQWVGQGQWPKEANTSRRDDYEMSEISRRLIRRIQTLKSASRVFNDNKNASIATRLTTLATSRGGHFLSWGRPCDKKPHVSEKGVAGFFIFGAPLTLYFWCCVTRSSGTLPRHYKSRCNWHSFVFTKMCLSQKVYVCRNDCACLQPSWCVFAVLRMMS